MREIHGEESPWWRSNILGIFPGAESVRFIPVAWLDACTRESVSSDELWRDYPAGSAVMGVDIGGGVGADRSVVVVRNRKQVLEIFASEWHGVLDDARHRLEPVVLDLAQKHLVPPDRVIYDKAGLGRSFGSYLAAEAQRRIDRFMATRAIDQHPDWIEKHCPKPFHGAVGYFGAGKGGKLFVNRRTACAFALQGRLDPHREKELAELRSPAMEMEEGQVKQVIEDKAALMERLHRSPDVLDALLMTFTYEG
jgi:hypothetical protein